MKRHCITLGAPTTAGGKVISASAHMKVEGAKIALAGDEISCPACKAIGKIESAGQRLVERCMGRDIALEDDLCRCGCAPPPRLIAQQTLKFQTIGEASPGPADESKVTSGSHGIFDEAFRALDKDAQPVAGLAYRIVLADGSEQCGVTDDGGYTHRVKTDQPSELRLYWIESKAPVVADEVDMEAVC